MPLNSHYFLKPDPDETAGEEPSIYNVSCVNDIPVSAINIATETRKDTILAQVCEYVMTGWPNYVSNELKLYFMKRNELSMEQGCLLWGYRVYNMRYLKNYIMSIVVYRKPSRSLVVICGGLIWIFVLKR